VASAATAVDWDALLAKEGLGSLDVGTLLSPGGTGMVSRRGVGRRLEPLSAEEMERRRTVLAEHEFRGRHMGPTSSVRPRRDRAVYRLHADGYTRLQIARKLRTTKWAVIRAIHRVERAYALRKAQGPTREMLLRLASDADPGLLVLVFMLLERTLEQPEAGREILRTARDIPELRGLLDG